MTLRVEILKNKFSQSLGLPFQELLPESTIKQAIFELKIKYKKRLAEPHEKLTRQAKSRKDLQKVLDTELRQLARSASYTTRINSIQDIASLLVQSSEEERQRFVQYRGRLLNSAEVIALSADILCEAGTYEAPYDLSPQDVLVYSSVISHLRQNQPQVSCFLNRNSKDFDNPDIVDELTSTTRRK